MSERPTNQTMVANHSPITLVLLPGMDGTGELFQPLLEVLGAEMETIVVRYPVYGPQDYATMEACVRRILPTQSPYLLLGESFSGPVATAIAASSPPGLQGLILCCTFVRPPRPEWLAPLAGIASIRILPGRLLSQILMGKWRTPTLQAALSTALARVPSSSLSARAQATLTVDATAKLQAVRVPVLYLRATRDQVVPRAAAAHVMRALPSARLVDVDAPHFLLQVAPQAATRAIRVFTGQIMSVFT